METNIICYIFKGSYGNKHSNNKAWLLDPSLILWPVTEYSKPEATFLFVQKISKTYERGI